MSKALENKGLNGGSEKKCPLPVNGYVGPRVHKNIYILYNTQGLKALLFPEYNKFYL
jgi:hypothetical protein